MPLDITSNAAEVAADLAPSLVDDAAERANQAAADEALSLVDSQTPRRTGTLAAGNRAAVASDGWAVVNAVPYASVVNARTGYASKTLIDNGVRLVAIYDRELQQEFDNI